MDDAQLVAAARGGSDSAVAAIFERHAPAVHDLALAMLRDRSAALEVVEATFLEAGRRLDGLREEHRLAVWLLAITRLEGSLRDGPTTGGDGSLPLQDDDPQRVRLAGLVWEAVADLPLLDRTMIDLALRHGVDGHDLVDALGVTLGQAQDLEERVRDIDKDLVGYLVAHTNDGGCPGLSRLLKGWDGWFAYRDPHHIGRHIETCPACTRAADALPPPFSLYAAIPAAPYPAEARHRALERLAAPGAPSEDPSDLAPPEPAPEVAQPSDLASMASAAFLRSAPAPSSTRTRARSSPPAPPPAPLLVLKVPAEPGANPVAEPSSARAADTALVPVGSPAPPDLPSVAPGATEAPQKPSEPWMPNGFPPSSFPMGERASTSTSASTSSGRPLKWLAAAAILAALLLLCAALLIADDGDQRTALSFGPTSTSAAPDTTILPDPTTAPPETTVPLAPTPAVVSPDGTATTASAAPPTTAPPPAAGSGLLVGFERVQLARVDSTVGPQRSALPLRNRSGSPVTFATRSSFAGLSVDRPTGTIGPGETLGLTITLDGTKAAEGVFTGTLTFDGTGGSQQVTVTTTVGRPPAMNDDAGPPCTPSPTPCSKLVQLVPGPNPDANATPCNTPWRYSLIIEDESRLRSVRADADLDSKDAELRRDGAPSGPAGRWQSDVFAPLPVATTLNVTIKAVDEFEFFRFRTERAIVC